MDVAAVPVSATLDPVGSVRRPPVDASSRRASLIGRCFVHPVVDYALVGGGITLPIFAALYFFPGLTPANGDITLRTFIFFNGAHFAASTVRLYTKPGAKRDFPFLSWGFPVMCLGAVWAGLCWPALGKNLSALYFSWSPYHYAAQTYGLAVMYAMRSGARLDERDKTEMWWVCLLPFLYALLTAKEGGLAWFVSREWLATVPVLWMTYRAAVAILTAGVFLLPVSLFWQLHRMRGRNVPAISLLLQITNGIWWLGTDYLNGWWWTAMFHSIQYLIIVVVRHVHEQMARTDASNPKLHRPVVYGSMFYGVSFVLGIFLFFIVPLVYVPLGFTATSSFTMMMIIINLHHFIVDGFIWRTKPAGGKPAASPRLDPVAAAV
jgi:hypothetical protein